MGDKDIFILLFHNASAFFDSADFGSLAALFNRKLLKIRIGTDVENVSSTSYSKKLSFSEMIQNQFSVPSNIEGEF